MVIGADLAINHGALVSENGNIIFTYSKGAGNDSSFDTLYNRARTLIEHIPPNSIVCIDWDRTSGSWGKKQNGLTATLMTAQIIAFATLCLEKGCEVHLVAPKIVRNCLKLPATSSKEKVHEHVKELIPGMIQKYKANKDVIGDCVDAWLLAHTFECAERK